MEEIVINHGDVGGHKMFWAKCWELWISKFQHHFWLHGCKKEDDLNSFVKVFWTLEKPAQDEFATSSVVIETDFLQMISKGIGLVIYFGFKFIFVHGFMFPRSNSPSLRSTRQWSHRKRGIVHGSCLGRLSATNALPPYSGSDHSVYELQVLEN